MKKLVSTVVSCAIAGSILTAPVAGAQETRIDELLIMRHSNGSPSVTVSCSADSKKSSEERIRQCKDASIKLLADALLNADKLAREQEEKLEEQAERFFELAGILENEQAYNKFLIQVIYQKIAEINRLKQDNQRQKLKIAELKKKVSELDAEVENVHKLLGKLNADNEKLNEFLLESLKITEEQDRIIKEQQKNLQDLNNQIEDLQDDNDALGEENDALREDYKKALDALKKSLEESKELAEKNHALKNQLANAQSKIEELEKKYAEAQRDILGLKNDNKRLEDLNKKNLDKLGETEGKLNTASILATVFGVISAIAAIIGIGGFLKPIIDRFFHHR
ncbi:coiled-coil domain-containing protein [Corynebacterium ulcerans]|uniref:Laminin subunit beta-1 n=1 Tax=Corynebacterium ulcerans TaxID=65058 RepID=A0ABD7MU86_CORUL|nr:hypothetical protein [Corynebacterium ulcerans]AEG82923.1 laminin subunit beta-1 [Corynebacterium ulcerans BR-AD22]NOL59164.1 hypothetical protein [Corynebacterium ulcerans]NOM03206.1 hypothetical protein [Corynebacterium ulcerans]QQU26354.1 hypothetical protein I6I75_03285 [Corynebacterium ulcerans]SNV11141.1 laminin subunit beta-1 [Corynebacterium ulcerans]